MRRALYFVPLVFIASCLRPPSPGPEPPKPPAQVTPEPQSATTALEGEWREIMNQRKPVRGRKRWVFRSGSVTITEGDSRYTGTFTTDESKEPAEIDFRFKGYPVNRGIYRIHGNRVIFKLLETAAERPSRFGLEKGYTLIVCRREK